MMKSSVLLIPLLLACVEPPSTDKAAGVESSGAAAPGAPEPGVVAGPGDLPAAKAAVSGPGAVVPDPGPEAPEGPAQEMTSQEEITDGVGISGTISCDGCKGTLIVRIEDASSHPPHLLTSASFTEPGAYEMKAPKDKKVVLMVIHDANNDGQPTPGEDIGIWTGGLLNTSTDTTDVDLAVGVMPDTPPIAPEGDDVPVEVPPTDAPAEIPPTDAPAEIPPTDAPPAE